MYNITIWLSLFFLVLSGYLIVYLKNNTSGMQPNNHTSVYIKQLTWYSPAADQVTTERLGSVYFLSAFINDILLVERTQTSESGTLLRKPGATDWRRLHTTQESGVGGEGHFAFRDMYCNYSAQLTLTSWQFLSRASTSHSQGTSNGQTPRVSPKEDVKLSLIDVFEEQQRRQASHMRWLYFFTVLVSFCQEVLSLPVNRFTYNVRPSAFTLPRR